MLTNNLKIITERGEIDYISASDIGIKLNRIVDDLNDLSNRFSDFSYSFSVPKTKNNNNIFQYADVVGNRNVFRKNENISCQVYINNVLIIDGIINLVGINSNSYECQLFSKIKEFVDLLDNDGGEERSLKDLNFPLIDFNYEETIINHINANYQSSDDTFYQFPFVFYSTNYCQTSYFSGKTDANGYLFQRERTDQNYYYLINNIDGNDNRMFYHQFPPAVYIVSIINQIFIDAGWSIGGQFFNDENIKKIIMLYAGDEELIGNIITPPLILPPLIVVIV